jgi:hypothetical protein
MTATTIMTAATPKGNGKTYLGSVLLPSSASRGGKGEEGEAEAYLPPNITTTDQNTLVWWSVLCLISLINICVWLYSYRALVLGRGGGEYDPTDGYVHVDHHRRHHHAIDNYQRRHLYLSGTYVFVCAYRSFLPRIDLERYCLWDTPLSSIFLGRLSATIAEICFACQISLLLHELGTLHHHAWSVHLSPFLVLAIVIAQIFCWFGVTTLNHVYHAIEETIWAMCGLFVGIEFCSLVLCHPENRPLVVLGTCGSLGCFVFFHFMITVDVPMYLKRWREGRDGTEETEMEQAGGAKAVAGGEGYVGGGGGNTTTHTVVLLRRMTTLEGGIDAIQRRVVTKSWQVWKEETLWLTGYFSSAVWLSLFLIHLPVPA